MFVVLRRMFRGRYCCGIRSHTWRCALATRTREASSNNNPVMHSPLHTTTLQDKPAKPTCRDLTHPARLGRRNPPRTCETYFIPLALSLSPSLCTSRSRKGAKAGGPNTTAPRLCTRRRFLPGFITVPWHSQPLLVSFRRGTSLSRSWPAPEARGAHLLAARSTSPAGSGASCGSCRPPHTAGAAFFFIFQDRQNTS